MPWINNDGLLVRFATERTVDARGGETSTEGALREITIDIDFSKLGAVGVEKVLAEGVFIPKNAILKTATLHTATAFASAGAATLTIGLIEADRSTAYDADGIDATIAVAALTAGSTIVNDGAVVGKRVANAQKFTIITATVGTAAFTAGRAQLSLSYYINK